MDKEDKHPDHPLPLATSIESYDQFDSSKLGLGDLSRSSIAVDSIAAVFDLEGFTKFCGQIDPQLSVPIFLRHFIDWIMHRLKNNPAPTKSEDEIQLYCPLPFFVKFMGDGLIVIWKSSGLNEWQIRNIINLACRICIAYRSEFLSYISVDVAEPPAILRCGIARGTVYSVGDEKDYVGPCINMAARLQKLPGISIAVNRRGINFSDASSYFRDAFITRRVSIRGIGDNELVGILKREFLLLSQDDRKIFRNLEAESLS